MIDLFPASSALRPSGLSAFPLATACASVSAECTVALGTYEGDSETEIAEYLVLDRNGKGAIIQEDWEPGKFDERSTHKVAISWSCKGTMVELEYPDVVDRLERADDEDVLVRIEPAAWNTELNFGRYEMTKSR